MRRAIILDTETTGLDASKAQIVEIAFKVVNTNSGECLASFQSVVALSEKEWNEADPGALKVNGFTWADIQTRGRPRSDIAVDICSLFSQFKLSPQTAFFLCQNPAFDKAFFSHLCPPSVQKSCRFPYYWLDFASMNWALTVKDVVAGKLLPFRIPFSKDGIAQHKGLPLEEFPHKAMNGVDHLLLLFTKIVGFRQNSLSLTKPLRRSLRNRTAPVESNRRRSLRNRTSTLFFKP